MNRVGDSELFLFPSAERHLPEIDEWLSGDPATLYAIARRWFAVFRNCGEDVRELLHDGCPTACVMDAAFGYVNVYKRHVNVGFYAGASLDDPSALLTGSGKRMRHVKLQPDEEIDSGALTALIETAYSDMKTRIS